MTLEESHRGARRPLTRQRIAPLTAMVGAALCALWALTGSAQAAPIAEHVPSAEDRYALANGCFALRSEQTGNYVVKNGPLGYAATATTTAAAEPFRMQATDLERYLFYGPTPDFMARTPVLETVSPAGTPSNDSDWKVDEDGSVFRIVNTVAGKDLAVGAANALVTVPEGTGGPAGRFTFDPAEGCADYPEVEVNVTGPLPAGQPAGSEVTGLVETHMHGMAHEFLGTKVHCGRPWHRFGAPHALVDCDDHQPNGCSAALEQALSGPGCHDTGGWPTFAGWPRHNHYTHEQSYYRWIERSWRAGLRIWVNLMVENRVLCEIYPLTPPPATENCDEMDSVRRQVQQIHAMEDYIDAQWGGPGKGWYRIVESPAQARQVINDGKLAVVKGMEVSEPFGCRLMYSPGGYMPLCSESQLDGGIDEIHDDLGIRQVEIVNKFDNALTGVAGDSGQTGTITNFGNWYSTGPPYGPGTFWDLEQCPPGPDDPNVNHDHSPTALSHNDDDLAAGILDLFGNTTDITPVPAYGPGPHCNQRGLSTLGERGLRRIMDKGMLFDPDHMSVLARNRALDIIEEEDYPGVMTSHSWSTDNALPRISRLGGLIGPAAKSSQKFVDDWNHIREHDYDEMNPHLFGFGYGADMNGFASQGGPPSDAGQITYPFRSPIDPCATVHQQRSGTFTFDYNAHGTAHYGLYPDWSESVRRLGGQEIADDMANAAEAYLQMWERATGAGGATGPAPSPAARCDLPGTAGGPGGGVQASAGGKGACKRWPRRFGKRGLGGRFKLGDKRATVLRKAGAPERRGRAWLWCAKQKGKNQRVAVVFKRGKVALILSTAGKTRAGKLGRGTKVKRLRRSADRLGRGLWARPAGKSRFFWYRVKRGRVIYTGVATKGASKPKVLRRYIKATH